MKETKIIGNTKVTWNERLIEGLSEEQMRQNHDARVCRASRIRDEALMRQMMRKNVV